MAPHRIAAVAALGLAGAAILLVGLPVPGAAEGLAVEAAWVPRGLLGPRGVGAIKAGVATLATALLLWGLWLERRGRSRDLRTLRDALLAGLGLLGAACWLNLFQFHYPAVGHASDTFHYYLGAKYFPELRYTRLYACTAVADSEAGAPAERPIRDLETNQLITSAGVLADPSRCKRHFSAARWAAFRNDVDFLRTRVPTRRWQRFQQDHGYNATPLWGAVGYALTQTGPASAPQLTWLRALDPLLLGISVAGLALAFGWRITCVAVIYFGTNYAAPYGWTGGSILRYDWLAASLLGLALLRRGWPASGGVLLTLAVLLRLFPVFLLAGIALASGGRWLKERRPSLNGEERRIALGVALTLAIALPVCAWLVGPESGAEFVRNSRTHLSTPLANHVGLRTVLSHDADHRSAVAHDPQLADPMGPWKEARRTRFASQQLFFWALVLGFGALVARAGAGAPAWVGAVLGVAWIPVAAELTGYYWSVLAALALLGGRHPVLLPGLCALSALGWAVASVWHWTDEIHVWLSVLTVAFCVFTVLLATPRSGRDASVHDSKSALK